MTNRLAARIAYGRSIRHRATCLIEAHGAGAHDAALEALWEHHDAPADRHFWQAVADRIARIAGTPARGLAAATLLGLGLLAAAPATAGPVTTMPAAGHAAAALGAERSGLAAAAPRLATLAARLQAPAAR